jgi:hypothetical protein
MNEFTPVVPLYPRLVFHMGYLKVTASVQVVPLQVSVRPEPFAGPVKFMPAEGQAETVTVSLMEFVLQALAVVLKVCVGEANFGVAAEVPAPLPNVLT